MSDQKYGDTPVYIGTYDLAEWEAFMHYLYLPVRLPWTDGFRNSGITLPPDLDFAYDLIADAWADAAEHGHQDSYIYLTARRGWATPDNPLNRPGWHCDGFGTDDLNYVWFLGAPTRYSGDVFTDISDDHLVSMEQFAAQVTDENVYTVSPKHLYRLNPFVVHTTPVVPHPGQMRSFLKVSFSHHRYNLLGNSHNYGLDYEWEMFPRDIARNDPARAMGDFYIPDA